MRKSQWILSVVLMVLSTSVIAQTDPATDLKTLVESKAFVFEATSMSPMKGGMRQLTTLYTLQIKGDTVHCDLPYAGRAYQADYGGTDGGMKFDSYDIEYNMKVGKKGGWDVTIKTKDLRNNRQLRLTISENGSASLNINCNDRQPISYRGVVKKNP